MHFPEAAVTSEHRPRLVHHGDLTKEGETTDIETEEKIKTLTVELTFNGLRPDTTSPPGSDE